MIRHFSLSWYPLYLSQEINGQGMPVGGVGGDMHESLELFWQTSAAVDLLIDLNGGTTLPSFVTVVCIIARFSLAAEKYPVLEGDIRQPGTNIERPRSTLSRGLPLEETLNSCSAGSGSSLASSRHY